jgi:hypothetical protein
MRKVQIEDDVTGSKSWTELDMPIALRGGSRMERFQQQLAEKNGAGHCRDRLITTAKVCHWQILMDGAFTFRQVDQQHASKRLGEHAASHTP